jgi:hypothetical protein
VTYIPNIIYIYISCTQSFVNELTWYLQRNPNFIMMQFLGSIRTKESGTYFGLLLFPNVTFLHKTDEIMHNVCTNVKWFFDFLE